MMIKSTRAHTARRLRRTLRIWLIGLGLVMGLIAVSQVIAQAPATYYVDASSGSDSNNGLSSDTAWRTMQKVNSSVFRPGDRVLFKRGEVWNTTLENSSSGEAGNPITFGAYGSGPRPVIDGQFSLSAGIRIYNQSHLVLESLEVRHNTGSGIWTGGTVSNLTLRDLNVHHNDSNGIFLDHVRDVLIEACEIHDQSGLTNPSLLGAGIDVLGGAGALEIRYCLIYNNATHGIYHETPGAHIHHNTIYGNGVGNASFAQHGVYSYADNTLVEYNEIHNNYTTGISMRKTGGVCQYNTCYDNGFAQIHYSQLDSQVEVSNTEFRFNVCWTTRDTSYGFSGTNMNDVRLYHNTFYCDTPGWTAAVEIPGDCRKVTLRNNIMCVTHEWAVSLFVTSSAQNVTEDHNWLQREDRSSDDAHINWKGGLYTLAGYQKASGQGVASLEGDPLFQDIALRNFALQPDSLAIDAGIDVGLPYNGAAPDMGAIETSATSQPAATPDLLVQAVSVSPTQTSPGGAVTVSFSVTNGGDATAGASTARVVLSADATITAGDATLANVSINSLSAGGSQSVSANVTIPSSAAAGSAYIGVIADVNGVVAESNESNNTAAASLTITQAEPSESITVTAPNGGESLQIGQAYTIRWSSSGVSGQVKIELSRNGGSSYETLFSSTANDGSESWTVAGSTTSQALIRISSVNNSSVSDTSDGPFSINQATTRSITITSPNGGETWVLNTAAPIQWTSDGISSGDGVNIELSRDDGKTFERLFTNVGNDGVHEWWVSGATTSSAVLRITHTNDASIADTSDQPFSIVASAPPPSSGGSITVVTPNGGEQWKVGSIQKIQWTSTDVTGSVTIRLSRDGGRRYTTLFRSTSNTGSVDWKVTGPASSRCLISIVSLDNGEIKDTSDKVFTIQ